MTTNVVSHILIASNTTAERMSVVPMMGEFVFDTDERLLYIGDGVAQGGIIVSDVENLTELINAVNDRVDDVDEELALKAYLTDLSAVALSGSYNDLTNTPLLGSAAYTDSGDYATAAQGDRADSAVQLGDLAPVATSGSYNDLTDKPASLVESVNGKTGVVVLDKTDIGLGNVDNTSDANKPVSTAVGLALNEKADSTALADVAFTGSYNDLTDAPSAPVTSVNTRTGDVVISKADVGLSNVDNTSDLTKPISDLTQDALDLKANEADLSVVATTGSYNDLLDKPTVVGQVNADWDATSGVEQILNKPLLGTAAETDASDYATAAQGELADTAVQPEDLATVATTGSYDDLSNKPTIPAAQVSSDWDATTGPAAILNKPALADVATSGSYNDLEDKPTLFSGAYDDLSNKPTLFSGAYDDLTNKPSIPDAQVNSDWSATSGVEQILNKPTTLSGYGITDAIPVSQKGANNGVATLGVNGKIPHEQIPTLAITDTFVVVSQVEMLALPDIHVGDIVVRTDESTTYINQTGVNTSMADWVELLSPPNAVISVAGKTGAVVLDKADVGLGNVDNTSDANKPVSTAQQTALNAKANQGDLESLESDFNDAWALLAPVATSGSYNDLTDKPTTAGGRVDQVTSGTGINVDSTDVTSPVVSMADMPSGTFKGRAVGSTGAPSDLTAAQARAILNVADGAQANVATNVSVGHTSTQVTISSSTGTGDTIASATTSLSGVMSAADKTKLNGIATGATANTGTVTSVAAGNGMTFTSITGSGSVTLATPGTIGPATTNSVQANSHTHSLNLAGAYNWTGVHTFNPNAAVAARVQRSGAANVSIEYVLSGGSVFAGAASSTSWNIAGTNAIGTAPWLAVSPTIVATPAFSFVDDGDSNIVCWKADTYIYAVGGGGPGRLIVGHGETHFETAKARMMSVTQHSNTTLTTEHVNRIVKKTNTTARTYTIASTTGVADDTLTFVNAGASANINVVPSGVTIYINGTATNPVVVPPRTALTLIAGSTTEWYG